MKTKTSRRQFARGLAALGASALAPIPGATQSPTAPLPASQTSQQDSKPSPQAEAMLQWLKIKFPDRLSEEQIQSALTDFQGMIRASERMSKASLKNSDEPDFTFSAGRPRRARRES